MNRKLAISSWLVLLAGALLLTGCSTDENTESGNAGTSSGGSASGGTGGNASGGTGGSASGGTGGNASGGTGGSASGGTGGSASGGTGGSASGGTGGSASGGTGGSASGGTGGNASGGTGGSGGNICDGVLCSGHGDCKVVSGKATCSCDSGYHSVALTCVKNTSSTDTVVDQATHLEWQDQPYTAAEKAVYNSTTSEAGKALKWIHAKGYCSKLQLHGGGWRLPTLKELDTIVDTNYSNPAIDPAFKNAPPFGFWSSTLYSSSTAWGIGFASGAHHKCGINNKAKYIRCVRTVK